MIGMVLSLALRTVIRAYQLVISPLVGARCRFAPTCSEYAAEAILRHGPGKGLWMALTRLARCHPWGGAGYDPVPLPHCSRHDHRGEGRLRSKRPMPTSGAPVPPSAPSASPTHELRA